MALCEPRKSIFTPKGAEGGRIEQAVKHNMSEGTFGSGFFLNSPF